jgi:antirestriction protein ArdC
VPGIPPFCGRVIDSEIVRPVTLLAREQFPTSESYYATAFHELTHSTNHAGRLNREPAQHENAPGRQWGDRIYAREELVAEMGSALLQAVTGIESEDQLDQSAAYIEDWLGALDKDPQLVSHAASQASKAADLILDPQRQAQADDDQAEDVPQEQPQRQAA